MIISGVCLEIKFDTSSSSVISSSSCGASMTFKSLLWVDEAASFRSKLIISVPSIPCGPVINIFIICFECVLWRLYMESCELSIRFQTVSYTTFYIHPLFLSVRHVSLFQQDNHLLRLRFYRHGVWLISDVQ